MDAQDTMRLMFDTMDAYDRSDFDRLGEIYAKEAVWKNSDPAGPHCENREDIFDMFRGRMESGIRVAFDELRLDSHTGACSRTSARLRFRLQRVYLRRASDRSCG
jgi:SnoaL-like domain